MYQVTSAFLEQMKSPIQEHKITGTIGSVSFSEANIVEGSFSISNQSTDTNDVVLGSCYVGQLTAEFVGINIAYGKWINKTITLSFGLKVGEYYEYVPLGVYKVKEAKHTDHGVQVTAYDNMIKFDKKFRKSHYMNLAGMVNIIDQLCSDAGVILGMSHADIEELPNGDRTGINIYGSKGKKKDFANDITTLRDLLFWVAQTLGCFATMNRAGQLEFRPYTQTVVDIISENNRIAGSSFEDYITHYVGIYVENLDSNTEDYYGYDTAALQQELNETMGEITDDQAAFVELENDRADWVQKLANHECTQEEYDAAIASIDAQEKALTKEIKQLSKRAEWLTNAIAQSANDGSDMVLGANPLTMAANLTTRDAQRREILGALDAISYTPFQASVVCGCIYDLGDVIQFSGGLYNSDTDSFGCVMSYTYTHNGGTELEGYGVDPSVVVVRNKTQKSADRANRNSIDAVEVFSGTKHPSEFTPAENEKYNDNTVYIQTKDVRKNNYPLEFYDYYISGTRPASEYPEDQIFRIGIMTWTDNGYTIALGGMMKNQSYFNQTSGVPRFKCPINRAGTYHFHCKMQYSNEKNSDNKQLMGFHFMFNGFQDSPPTIGIYGVDTNSFGVSVNCYAEQNQEREFEGTFTINQNSGAFNRGYCEIWFGWDRAIQPYDYNNGYDVSLTVTEFYVEFVGDSHEDNFQTKVIDTFTKQSNQWEELTKVKDVDSVDENSGLKLVDRVVKLKSNVMRAWIKHDPPQVQRDFNQFCVRVTGTPYTTLNIEPESHSVVSNISCTRDSERVYKVKCGGTVESGANNIVVYKITGMGYNPDQAVRNYVDFVQNFSGDTTFNAESNRKACGVLFLEQGTIPDGLLTVLAGITPQTWYHGLFDSLTYDYYSFRRETRKIWADGFFEARTAAVYMFIILNDVTTNDDISVSLSELVVARSRESRIRQFYLHSVSSHTWLPYKPFGAMEDGEVIDSLGELTDVDVDGATNGQFLKYNSTTGKWENGNSSYTLPIASASTLGGIKVGDNLTIDAETGVLSAQAGGVTDYDDLTDKPSVNGVTLSGNKTSSDLGIVITLTQAQYDALTTEQKNDPNKVYYISDASGGGSTSPLFIDSSGYISIDYDLVRRES